MPILEELEAEEDRQIDKTLLSVPQPPNPVKESGTIPKKKNVVKDRVTFLHKSTEPLINIAHRSIPNENVSKRSVVPRTPTRGRERFCA